MMRKLFTHGRPVFEQIFPPTRLFDRWHLLCYAYVLTWRELVEVESRTPQSKYWRLFGGRPKDFLLNGISSGDEDPRRRLLSNLSELMLHRSSHGACFLLTLVPKQAVFMCVLTLEHQPHPDPRGPKMCAQISKGWGQTWISCMHLLDFFIQY